MILFYFTQKKHMKYPVETLRKLNLSAGCLHLISLIALVVFTIAAYNSDANTVDTSTYNVSLVACGEAETCDIISGTRGYNVTTTKNFSSDTDVLVALVFVFVFLTAVFHLIIYKLPSYTNLVENGNNFIRWVEYSITATIMLILIALTVGVKETSALALIVCESIVVMLMGHLTERAFFSGDTSSAIMLIVLAFFLILSAFGIIFWAYGDLTMQVPGIPKFVTPIVILEFFLFMAFGFVQSMYIARAVDYSQSEIGFVTLSFIAKTLLSWLLFAGIVMR